MKARKLLWFILILASSPGSIMAAGVDATVGIIEAGLADALASDLPPGQRATRAGRVVERCQATIGPPDKPREIAGVRPNDPLAHKAARAQAVCAIASYLAGERRNGDAWRVLARSLDPTVDDGPGIPDDTIRLGAQLEGALAASFDPLPEPMTLEVAIDRPIPRVERVPSTAPGSHADGFVTQANTSLRRQARGVHALDLTPGLYRITAGSWSDTFLVPADPADQGRRTQVRLTGTAEGGFALERQQHDQGYVPPPGTQWPESPPATPVSKMAVARTTSLVVGGTSAAVGLGCLVAMGVGDVREDNLSLSAVERQDAMALKDDGADGAIIGFSIAGGMLATWGALVLVEYLSDEEEAR